MNLDLECDGTSKLSSLRLLPIPLLPQRLNIPPAHLSLAHHGPRLAHNRRIHHPPLQRPRPPPRPLRLRIRHHDPHRPLHLALARPKRPLRRLHLVRMDQLLAVEAQPAAVLALVGEGAAAVVAAERGADEVDGRGQAVGARGGDDGAAGVEELAERGGAGEGEVEGEVLGGEDEAGEVGGGGADGGEVDEGFGGFDEGDEAEGLLGLLVGVLLGGGGSRGVAVREGVADDVGDEVEVRGGVYFGDDEGVEVGGLELWVGEREVTMGGRGEVWFSQLERVQGGRRA